MLPRPGRFVQLVTSMDVVSVPMRCAEYASDTPDLRFSSCCARRQMHHTVGLCYDQARYDPQTARNNPSTTALASPQDPAGPNVERAKLQFLRGSRDLGGGGDPKTRGDYERVPFPSCARHDSAFPRCPSGIHDAGIRSSSPSSLHLQAAGKDRLR